MDRNTKATSASEFREQGGCCQRKCMHGIQLLQTETIRHSKAAQSLSTICFSLRVVNKMDGRQYSYEKYQIYLLIIYSETLVQTLLLKNMS